MVPSGSRTPVAMLLFVLKGYGIVFHGKDRMCHLCIETWNVMSWNVEYISYSLISIQYDKANDTRNDTRNTYVFFFQNYSFVGRGTMDDVPIIG